MSVSDPIADMILRIRNAIMIASQEVEMPSSKMKEKILSIMKEEGYIQGFEVSAKGVKKTIRVHLKYSKGKKNVINKLKRVSTPGRHIYVGSTRLPRIQGGFGTAIISTSKGIMTDRKARAEKIGGEVICYIS